MNTEVKKFNRFQQALDVQNACNPSGVSILLTEIIQDAMRNPIPGYGGTINVCKDPAVVLVIDKLHDMTGRTPYLMRLKAGTGELEPTVKNFCNAYDACEKLAKNINYGIGSLRWYSEDVVIAA